MANPEQEKKKLVKMVKSVLSKVSSSIVNMNSRINSNDMAIDSMHAVVRERLDENADIVTSRTEYEDAHAKLASIIKSEDGVE